MKRSGGVTAAAIVLILGSALFVLMAVIMVFASSLPQATKEPNPLGPAFFYIDAGFMLGLAGWGLATGVGILQLRKWARISILVMSGIATTMLFFMVISILLFVPILKRSANLPAGMLSSIEFFEVILFSIPLGIAIWWLVLFLRKSVRMQFETVPGPAVAQPFLGLERAAQVSAVASSSVRKIPVSILVIAIYFLATAPFSVFIFAFPFLRHMPMMIFGTVMHAGSFWAYTLAATALHLVLGIGLLRRRMWAYLATGVYCVFLFANSAATMLRPSAADSFLKMMQEADPALGQASSNLPPEFFHYQMYAGAIFGMALAGVGLYFLWTRRAAYRAACAASGASPVAAR